MSLLNRSTIQRIGLECQYKDDKSIDECAILAMNLLRLTTLFTATSLPTIVIKVIERLRNALVRYDLDEFPQCLDVYIWACFVGMVHEVKTPIRNDLAALVGQAFKIKYKSPIPGDWQAKTLSMLRSFLWSDTILTDLYTDACDLVDCGCDIPLPVRQAGTLRINAERKEPPATDLVPNRFLVDRHHSAP